MKLRKSFFKKFFLISGGLLLAISAIFAIAYTILNIKWGGDLRRELDKLKAFGEPMTIKDIAPVPLSSSDNASIEYLQIFSLMTNGTFSMKGSGEESKDMKELDTLCFSKKTCRNLKNSARRIQCGSGRSWTRNLSTRSLNSARRPPPSLV